MSDLAAALFQQLPVEHAIRVLIAIIAFCVMVAALSLSIAVVGLVWLFERRDRAIRLSEGGRFGDGGLCDPAEALGDMPTLAHVPLRGETLVLKASETWPGLPSGEALPAHRRRYAGGPAAPHPLNGNSRASGPSGVGAAS